MTTSARGALIREVAELMEVLQQDIPDLDAVLGELTEGAVKAVPAAQYAGITVASRDGEVRTASATGHYPALLDEIQQS